LMNTDNKPFTLSQAQKDSLDRVEQIRAAEKKERQLRGENYEPYSGSAIQILEFTKDSCEFLMIYHKRGHINTIHKPKCKNHEN